MDIRDWDDFFTSLRFTQYIYIVSNTLSDRAMRGLATNRKLYSLTIENSPYLEKGPAGEWLREMPLTGEGLSNLSGLPRLRDLGLHGIHLTRRERNLGSLTQLETLSLYDDDPDDDGAAISANLVGLRNLKSLCLSGDAFTDASLVNVGKMRSLTGLWLSGDISDDGLRHLKGLTQLAFLDLQGSAVSDRGIEHIARLTSLRSLDLSRTAVTDSGLPGLQSLKNLESLDLCRTAATSPAIQRLVHALPRIEVMWIVKEATDDSPEEYGIATGKSHPD